MKKNICAVLFVTFFISTGLLFASEKTADGAFVSSQLQKVPYSLDLQEYPEYSDYQKLLQEESNIPEEDFMSVKYIGILTQEEFELCSRGAEQRTKALLLFLKDIYSGENNVIKDNIIPESIVEYAMESQGFREFVGKLQIETMAIICGSDLNLQRNQDGKITVIEDNIGSLGGREDIYAMADVLRRSFEQFNVFDPYQLESDYINKMKSWFLPLSGKYVMYCSDAIRMGETFSPKRAVLNEKSIDFADQDDLYVLDDRVFLKSYQKGDNDFEVSFIDHNGYDFSLDLSCELFRNRYEEIGESLEEAQDIPGSLGAILAGNLIVGHAPGTSMADSKIIYPFVEEFIRYYLGEEPIFASTKSYGLMIDNIPVHEIPSLSLAEAIENKDELVLKPIRGAGGYGVVVGKNVDDAEWFEAVEVAFSSCPEDFLFFEYVEILQEKGYSLIHRVFVDAYQEHTSTRPGAYLRMTEAEGAGVVRVGAKDTVATVSLIEKINCDGLLQERDGSLQEGLLLEKDAA